MQKSIKEQILYSKKGQVTNVVGSIIALVIGIGVATLVMVFIGVLGGSVYQQVETQIDAIGNNVITAESFVAHNGTIQQLAHNFIQEGTLSIYNASTNFGLTNFTIDYVDGSILTLTSIENGTINGSTYLTNYTWGSLEIRNHIKGGVVAGFDALETTGTYLPIIVLAVVIFLVLALVLGFTNIGAGFGGGRGSVL